MAINLNLYYYIFDTGALHGSRTISSPATGVSIIEALDDAGAFLVRAILGFGSGYGSSGSGSASSTVVLRFRPRFALSAVASSASGVALLHFRPRLPLPLAFLGSVFYDTLCSCFLEVLIARTQPSPSLALATRSTIKP
jgi:hypothetical protein